MSQSNDSGLNLDHLEALDERAAFESAQRKYHWPLAEADLRQDKIGNYYNHVTQSNWGMWQARAALANQPASTVPATRDWYERMAHMEIDSDCNIAAGAPTVPAGDALHDAIMRLPSKPGRAISMNGASLQAYKEGHRDARHAAAELALAHQPAQEQAEPVARISAAELRDIKSGLGGVPVRGNQWRDDQTIPLFAGAAPQAPAAAAPDALDDDAAEGVELLDTLIDNIATDGNYSAEATLTFLSQIRQCFASPVVRAQSEESEVPK